MRTRVLAAGLGVWLGVVVVGSGMTWLVIDHAGRDVVAGQPAVEHVPAAQLSPDSSAPGPSASTSAHPHQHRPTPSPTPGGTATQAPTPTAVAPSSKPLSPRGGPSQPSSGGSGSGGSTQGDDAHTVTRTWAGAAGRVTVSCTGARADLVSASPADGWTVEVGDRGPVRVEVEFKKGGDDGGETRVGATCVSGAPRFGIDRGD